MFKNWPVYVVLTAALVSGCGEAPAPPVATPTESVQMTSDDHAKPKLSAEDQALADKQKICPVGGEALGSMGTPVKVMVGDRSVFLCCEGCRGAVEKDPEKYLAKLDAQTTPAAEPAATETPAAPATEAEAPAKP